MMIKLFDIETLFQGIKSKAILLFISLGYIAQASYKISVINIINNQPVNDLVIIPYFETPYGTSKPMIYNKRLSCFECKDELFSNLIQTQVVFKIESDLYYAIDSDEANFLLLKFVNGDSIAKINVIPKIRINFKKRDTLLHEVFVYYNISKKSPHPKLFYNHNKIMKDNDSSFQANDTTFGVRIYLIDKAEHIYALYGAHVKISYSIYKNYKLHNKCLIALQCRKSRRIRLQRKSIYCSKY